MSAERSTGTSQQSSLLDRVANDVVWRQTRILFVASALLFLVTIGFGFLNALTSGPLPRWQSLIHLHSGSIGWITLSLIGIAIWLFTGQRHVTARYERAITWLVRLSILFFAGYIASFAIAFSQGGEAFVLLVVFGASSMLMIWAAAIFAVTQLRRIPLVTNVHVLVTAGLLVAAVGATMGVLLGLEYVVGDVFPMPGERIGIHAGMMDAYLLLVASGIVEWFVRHEDAGSYTRSGLAQTLTVSIAALLVPIAFVFDLMVLLPVFVLLLLVFLVLFAVRMGWRAVRVDPLAPGVRTWGFFGTLWLAVFVVLFVYAIVGLNADFAAAPRWFAPAFGHSAFVGMMTNLLFGVYSARTTAHGDRLTWGEPAALWITNLGLVIFLVVIATTGTRHGAMVMGLGTLLGVGTMLARLQAE